jgi:HSP20 family protein
LTGGLETVNREVGASCHSSVIGTQINSHRGLPRQFEATPQPLEWADYVVPGCRFGDWFVRLGQTIAAGIQEAVMLMRFDPFRELAFRELDRMSQAMTGQGTALQQRTMPIDAYRDGDRFIIRFDLPGVDRDSIELTAEKNVLTVRAERNWPPREGQEVVVAERPQGTFTRQLFLGESLDVDRITATYDQGVLTLVVPVAEQAKPRRVEIAEGSSTADGSIIAEGSSTAEGTGAKPANSPA